MIINISAEFLWVYLIGVFKSLCIYWLVSCFFFEGSWPTKTKIGPLVVIVLDNGLSPDYEMVR
jgi:hypothetical protein